MDCKKQAGRSGAELVFTATKNLGPQECGPFLFLGFALISFFRPPLESEANAIVGRCSANFTRLV